MHCKSCVIRIVYKHSSFPHQCSAVPLFARCPFPGTESKWGESAFCWFLSCLQKYCRFSFSSIRAPADHPFLAGAQPGWSRVRSSLLALEKAGKVAKAGKLVKPPSWVWPLSLILIGYVRSSLRLRYNHAQITIIISILDGEGARGWGVGVGWDRLVATDKVKSPGQGVLNT